MFRATKGEDERQLRENNSKVRVVSILKVCSFLITFAWLLFCEINVLGRCIKGFVSVELRCMYEIDGVLLHHSKAGVVE